MKLNKMREEMTASFLAALKEEKMPWHKEWSSINGRPRNAINGSHYRGVNAFWLSYNQDIKDYTDPRWCTYNQAKAQGWQVRKGEKGTKVEFWSLYDTETKEKITKQQAEELQKQLSKEDFYDRVKPISNVYTVFNGEQIEGIPEITVERHMLDEQSLMEKRDILLKNMEVGFQEGKEGAFYQSKTDVIGMPDMERFENEYAYLSTFLHEAGHATGHESRLNRKLGNAFGSPEYAKEELRAEIASAFTAQALGIDARNQEHMENHKAYVQSWIEVLEKNPEELFAAIRDAEIISDYLIEKGEFEILEVKQTEKGKEKGMDQEREETTEEFNGLDTVPEVKNDTMKKIEEFAKEHNVPIYEEMPEGFHINEGAMTAPPGAKWIMDNAPILEKKSGLLLDKEMIQLLESQTATHLKTPVPKKHFYTKEESQQMTAYLREHISIVDVCSSLGYTPVRVGQNYYELKEHDSVRLDIRSGKNCFYWNSTGDRGSVIDACQAFGNMSEADAFQYLYDMAGGKEAVYDAVFGNNPDAVSYKPRTEFVNDHSEKKIPAGEVQLPPKGTSNRNVYAYLGKTRQISGEVITEFFKRDMLYQDDHNNCVFVSRDGDGKPVFGCKRGTSTYQRFVADCSGNDYSKGFYVDNGGDKLFVGESVIDIMSKMSMLREESMDYHDYNYLALAGTQKQDPVLNVLDSHPEIKEVVLGLDHDAGGLKATEEIINSLMKRDITVKKDMPIEEGQDWNDALRSYRKAKETGEHQDMDQKVTENVEPDNVVEGDSIPKEPLMVEKIIEKYMNQTFDGFQMHEIRKGIEAGVDVELYATPDFNSWQMGKIREGLEQGLDVSIYAKPEFDFSQMNQILWGLQKGLDVSVYAKPEFNNLQMVEIKLGLAKGQDVSQYADPAMDYKEMNKIRTEQKDALKDSQSPSKEELQDRPGSARDLKGKMNAEEIYQRMTDAEKEIYDMNVDFGDRDGAKKMLEEKAKELEKENIRDHPDQVDEIKKSIENPSGEAKDLTVYTNPSQMETVKELIQRSKEQGLNVTVYADERYTDQQREALRDEIQSCFEENSRQSNQEQMEGIWDSGSDQNPDYIKIFGQSQNNGMNQDSLSKMAVNRRILQRRGVEL